MSQCGCDVHFKIFRAWICDTFCLHGFRLGLPPCTQLNTQILNCIFSDYRKCGQMIHVLYIYVLVTCCLIWRNMPLTLFCYLQWQWRCTTCGKEFGSKGNLERHKDSIHLGLRYRCDICGTHYSQKGQVVSHKKTAHHSITTHIMKWLQDRLIMHWHVRYEYLSSSLHEK